jgi:hypothetical protein
MTTAEAAQNVHLNKKAKGLENHFNLTIMMVLMITGADPKHFKEGIQGLMEHILVSTIINWTGDKRFTESFLRGEGESVYPLHPSPRITNSFTLFPRTFWIFVTIVLATTSVISKASGK